MTRRHRTAHLWIWILVASAMGWVVAAALLDRARVELRIELEGPN
jgi:hypothetical protein